MKTNGQMLQHATDLFQRNAVQPSTTDGGRPSSLTNHLPDLAEMIDDDGRLHFVEKLPEPANVTMQCVFHTLQISGPLQ